MFGCVLHCFRTIDHENIVKYKGVCYSTSMPKSESGTEAETFSYNKLMVVLELCDCSLKTRMFRKKRLLCRYTSFIFISCVSYIISIVFKFLFSKTNFFSIYYRKAKLYISIYYTLSFEIEPCVNLFHKILAYV